MAREALAVIIRLASHAPPQMRPFAPIVRLLNPDRVPPAMFRQALLLLHLLAAMAWVGGMFFAYFCLRPSAAEVLEPPKRLPLWLATLARFLRYMAFAVLVVVVTGVVMLSSAGFRSAPIGWHVMFAVGLVMAAVYAYVHAGLLPALRVQCSSSNWPAAAQVLNSIRRLVALNLTLGVVTVIAAVTAR